MKYIEEHAEDGEKGYKFHMDSYWYAQDQNLTEC